MGEDSLTPLATLGAAIVGGLITGVASLLAIREQHKNSVAERKEQWEHEQEILQKQRNLDRQREYDNAQLEAIRALELTLPSFSRASRALFEAKQERHELVKAGKRLPKVDAELQAYVAQFNDLRYVAMGCITKIGNERLRRRAGHLYALDESMAVSDADVWVPGREVFGGHDPIILQVTWQEQLLRMTGKVYRDESIDGEFVEEKQHSPDPRKSAQPVITKPQHPI